MPKRTSAQVDRVIRTVAHAGGEPPVLDPDGWVLALARSVRLGEVVSAGLAGRRVVITGTLDRRLVLIENDTGECWAIADLSGRSHRTRQWPTWTAGRLSIAEQDRWLSEATITAEGLHRLLRPRVLLASLYHPEHFPLPRFPLAISDLARAARGTLLGQVDLADMQLGVDLDTIVHRATGGEVDIVGISATFGQHDLLVRLLDEINALPQPPLVVVGGSLTVRNEGLLLERYPNLLVARGAGEPTIADVLAYWHGDLAVDQVRGIGYLGSHRGAGTLSITSRRRNATVANRLQADIWPELDLLDDTVRHHGVAQLETSRGCTNFCSFCPRGHKGQWAGATPDDLPWLLDEYAAIFDRHPAVSRTLYLVDEEFIGRDEDAVPRALAVADRLHGAGFRWETSCRVDQVSNPGHDRDWHVQRARLWRGLVQRGLRRCLFGVESGVTSILGRFNKETTGEQNSLAIRTLTALGVPPRFTYITFDQLMTLDELRATHAYQGRTDLLLQPQPDLDVEAIVEGVRDERWVAENTTGLPFYAGISYLLVSMECLVGAAYTRAATAAGLTGEHDPAMGRVDARFADWRIGLAARWAQRWIDRHFALDYTLKSLEKLLDDQPKQQVRQARRTIKTAAYRLLGSMIEAIDATNLTNGSADDLDAELRRLAEHQLTALRADLDASLTATGQALTGRYRALLRREHNRWTATTSWRLINAADPCGT